MVHTSPPAAPPPASSPDSYGSQFPQRAAPSQFVGPIEGVMNLHRFFRPRPSRGEQYRIRYTSHAVRRHEVRIRKLPMAVKYERGRERRGGGGYVHTTIGTLKSRINRFARVIWRGMWRMQMVSSLWMEEDNRSGVLPFISCGMLWFDEIIGICVFVTTHLRLSALSKNQLLCMKADFVESSS